MRYSRYVVEQHPKSTTLIHESGHAPISGQTRSLTPLERFRPIISVSVEMCQLVAFGGTAVAYLVTILH